MESIVFCFSFLVISCFYIGLAFLIAMGAYTGFQRLTSSANSSHSNASGRYRGTRWSGGGANVRGVGDLPKPPPSG